MLLGHRDPIFDLKMAAASSTFTMSVVGFSLLEMNSQVAAHVTAGRFCRVAVILTLVNC